MPCSGFGHPEPVEVPSVTVHMGGPGSESHQGNGAVSGLQEDCGIWAVPALSPGLLTRAIQLAQEGLFPGRNFQTFLCKQFPQQTCPHAESCHRNPAKQDALGGAVTPCCCSVISGLASRGAEMSSHP